MTRRRRTLLLATLALAAPLPAFGLSGGATSAPEPTVADLGVSAELDSCGLMKTQIVCQFSVSYTALANATSYTASITGPDGSVTDYGSVPAGGTTLTVPYAGDGTYGVRVTAYGVPEEQPDAEEQVIATDVAESPSDAPAEPRVAPKEDPVKATATPRHVPSPDPAGNEVRVTPEPSCTEQPPAEPTDPQNGVDATTATDPAAAQPQAAEAAPAPDPAAANGTDPAAVDPAAPATAQATDPAATEPPAEPVPAPEPDTCPGP